MAATTGTYSLEDLKALDESITVEDFGEEQAAQVVAEELAAHNRKYQDMASALMLITTERELTYGGGSKRTMKRIDEYGRTPTQRQGFRPGKIGLPLDRFGDALGWTRDYMVQTPVRRFALDIAAMREADLLNLYDHVRRALFSSINYTWYDYLVDDMELEVKALVNGDGMRIPMSPEGQTFGADHTHYLAGALDAANIDAAVETVMEHGHTGQVVIYLNRLNQDALAALPDYTPAQVPLLTVGSGETVANFTLDNSRQDNRRIGVWRGLYEVWVKPWVPANYLFVHDTQGPKPLALRNPAQATLTGLRLVGDIDMFPLRANYYERRFGVAVRERTNGAVLYFGGGSEYVVPAFDSGAVRS